MTTAGDLPKAELHGTSPKIESIPEPEMEPAANPPAVTHEPIAKPK